MTEDGLKLGWIGFAGITHVDLVMLSTQPDAVLQAILQHEGFHAIHCRGFGRVWADMLHLNATSLLEGLQPELVEGGSVTAFEADRLARLFESRRGNNLRLKDHQGVAPIVLHRDVEHAILNPPQALEGHHWIVY